MSFKWIWPTLVALRGFKVGRRLKNVIFGPVFSTILAVSKRPEFSMCLYSKRGNQIKLHTTKRGNQVKLPTLFPDLL